MYKGWLANMAKRINHSDVVLAFEIVAVVFGDFVRKTVWVKTKSLLPFVVSLDGCDLHIPSEDFILSRIGKKASCPLGL